MPLIRSHLPSISHTAFASPPFPGHPVDRRSEGLLMAMNRRGTRKKRTKQRQRKSFIVRHPAMTLTDMM